MQLLNLTALLGLAASVSAIDVGLRVRGNCDSRGGGGVCTNLNPNTCCGVTIGSFASLIFYAIPTDWFLQLRAHDGSNCDRLRTADTVLGVTEKCFSNGPYTGAGYSFVSKKRGAGLVLDGTCPASQACTPVEPDQFFLADGQKYNVTDMDKGLAEQLWGLVEKGAVTADIPEVFKAFEISA